jgi:hypothetical protein
VIALAERTENGSGAKDNKYANGYPVPLNERSLALKARVVEKTTVAQFFPPTPNNEGGLTGVSSQIIAGANGAIDVRRTRQVFHITSSAQRRVTTGSWSSPGGVLAVRGDEGERVLRVDSADGRPRQLDSAKHVANGDAAVADGDARRPVESPRSEGYEHGTPAETKNVLAGALHDHQNDDQRGESDHYDREHLPKSGTKNYGLTHSSIVARVQHKNVSVATTRRSEMQVNQ